MDATYVAIEKLCVSHIPEVVDLDLGSIHPAWSETLFMAELETRESHSWVLSLRGRVTAYIVTRVSGDEAEILRIAVTPGARRLGYGSDLLALALEKLAEQGVRQVYLEVRSSNTPARSFYEAHRFQVAGKRTNYYSNPDEDALILRRTLQ